MSKVVTFFSEGAFADEIAQLFRLACRRAGVAQTRPVLSTVAFVRPSAPRPQPAGC